MPARRILSLWFPRLAAERCIRLRPELAELPFAVVGSRRGALVLASLGQAAEIAGLRRGMGLADARAVLPDLVTAPADPVREAAFLGVLARWAGRFSPWVAIEHGAEAKDAAARGGGAGTGGGASLRTGAGTGGAAAAGGGSAGARRVGAARHGGRGRATGSEGETGSGEGLVLDITGCAHLFGGEAGLVAAAVAGLEAFGLTVRAGLADTIGAAWAVARHGARVEADLPVGDAIDQEVHATRSRAARRVAMAARVEGAVSVVPPGAARAVLGLLPVAALRLQPEAVAALSGLGLRRIADLAALPRAQLARRVGLDVVRRLDQALGREPEPVAAPRSGPRLAVRLTAPEPLGLAADVRAGLARLAEALAGRLRAAGLGARRVRAVLERVDGGAEVVEAGFARPVDAGAAMMRVLELKLEGLEAGFGFEILRLAAVTVEPKAAMSPPRRGEEGEALADLLGRLGGRIGLDALVRLHPADSNLPEKEATEMAAGFSSPCAAWPRRGVKRPLVLIPPEPVAPQDGERPPRVFRWRRRQLTCAAAFGPERIAPEWWLDDPAWRSGTRAYWRVETTAGMRLWLFEALGGESPGGWFVQGQFD